jgi:hypothetical protein
VLVTALVQVFFASRVYLVNNTVRILPLGQTAPALVFVFALLAFVAGAVRTIFLGLDGPICFSEFLPDLCDDRGVVRSRVRSSFIHLPMLHVGSPAFRFHEAVRNTQDIVHVYDQSGDLDVTYSDWHAFRLPLWTILSVLGAISFVQEQTLHEYAIGDA